jgi:hypothetical protein
VDELAQRIADVAEAVHEANKRTLDPVIVELRDSTCSSNQVSRSAMSSSE